MKKKPKNKKRSSRKLRNVVLVIILLLFLLAGGVFFVGYYYYGKIIQTYVSETVKQESNGLYKAEVGNIYLNVIEGSLKVRDLKLLPDTALYRQVAVRDTLSPLLFSLSIDRFEINNFKILKVLRERKINIDSIFFNAPEITVYRMNPSTNANNSELSPQMMRIPLPEGLNSISVEKIKFENGKLDFYDFSGEQVFYQSVPSCAITITNILVDSIHRGEKRLFNADDISIKINDISYLTKNGFNNISFSEAGLSTGSNSLYINDFKIEPQYNRHDYSRKLGYQTDRTEISIRRIQVERFNFREFILQRKIKAGQVLLDSLVLDDYRDKRVDARPGFKPKMPHEAIRSLKTYLKIDTLILKNGRADYAEQVGDEPGTLFFDKMNATFTNLTNDPAFLKARKISELNATAYLMGKGKLDATIRFDFGDVKNSFSFSARVGSFDLVEINPFLSKLIPAEVKSGKVKELIIPKIDANDDVATGRLLFYYNDLSVAMTVEKANFWNKILKKGAEFLINDVVVNDDNPTKTGKMTTGIVRFERDKEKSILNYLWKTTFSGLKSTLGINSKEQKKVIKAEKKQKAPKRRK